MATFYRVGGCVRDEIMGIPCKDIDYSVEAESYDDMRQAILDRGGHIFLEKPEYFTVRAHVPGLGACDFVLCRKDGDYTDGRRPDSVEAGTLLDDLSRRDFTMNAMARTEQGGIIDPFNGRADIENRVIRCVGNPRERFAEDYLRMLRAVRFAVTKNMVIAEDVATAIITLGPYLESVAVERAREELDKALRVDTCYTLILLSNLFLTSCVFVNGLWLKPTLEKP